MYLNHEWDDAWGGSLELHSDPRARRQAASSWSRLFTIAAVIFETTETSWHGFGRIGLPEDKNKLLTRKSIALYILYARAGPPQELADTHSTIYVDRPLPEHFRPGTTLGADPTSRSCARCSRAAISTTSGCIAMSRI